MGGLGKPETVLVIISLFSLIGLILFPIWGYHEGKKRSIGAVGGLLLGFFLGIFGILIVYCTQKMPDKNFYDLPSRSSADDLQKFKKLVDSGAISEAEFNTQKSRILNSSYSGQY